jgi:chaperonin GroES
MGTINRLLKLSKMVNVAEELDQADLDKIGQRVRKGFDDDDASRATWKKKNQEYLDLAMQVATEKTFPWPGAANVKFPTLLIAAIQFQARAYPALIPGKDIVKGKVTGYDQTGEKAKKADRIGKHMSYQLTEEMTEWEDDTDRGLMVLPVAGSFFKKTYYDQHQDRNISKAVWAQNLVVDYKAPDLARTPRISEEFELYPQEIKERINCGMWSDVEIQFKNEDEDEAEQFIEQHTTWDIDGDGYKEPYIITLHKESSKIVRIVARYDEDSLYFMDGDNQISVGQRNRDIADANNTTATQNMQSVLLAQKTHDMTGQWEDPVQVPPAPAYDFSKDKITKIVGTEYYTQYVFFPSIDGSIYGLGFGQLLEALSEAINTNINQMLDASALANLGGGFKSKASKMVAGKNLVGAGEYIDVETNGQPLRDSLLPFDFRGPSQASFSLLELLLAASKDITGTKDILMGDTSANATATTTMIIREEGMRVYTAIYKRIFRAMKEELRKLYALNRKYLPDESYFQVLDTQEKIQRSDYTYDDTDVHPVSDPTIATAAQRIMKAETGLKFVGDPDFDSRQLKREFLEAMDYPNIDKVMPEKQPNPQAAELGKIQLEELKAKVGKIHTAMILDLANAEKAEIGSQIEIYSKQMEALLAGQPLPSQAGAANVDQGETGGMAQQPNDTGDLSGLVSEGSGTGAEPGAGIVPGQQGQPA